METDPTTASVEIIDLTQDSDDEVRTMTDSIDDGADRHSTPSNHRNSTQDTQGAPARATANRPVTAPTVGSHDEPNFGVFGLYNLLLGIGDRALQRKKY